MFLCFDIYKVEQLTEETLHSRFKKYGPIESIKIFNHCKNSGKKYAYIQYIENKDAYLAFLDLQKKRRKLHSEPEYIVIPADTWQQPLDNTTESGDVEINAADFTTMDKLNVDCLIRIFECCDDKSLVCLSEVNQLFNRILSQDIFPKHKKLSFNLDRGHEYRERTDMSLAQMRRYGRCFGPYLTEVQFHFHYNDKPSNLPRMFNKFTQYVGSNLKKIFITQLVLEEKHLNELKPVLSQLEYLKIVAYNEDFEYDIDFRSLCPNLKTLKLLHHMQFVHCAQPWPKLENLSVLNNEYMVIETVCLLMQNNPQLKRLKLTAFSCDTLLQNLGRYLTNLEKLTAYQGFPDISASTLVYLTNLPKLHTLKLMYLDEIVFNGILEFLPKLTGLQKLKLHLFSDGGPEDEPEFTPNHRLVIALSQELIDLKVFHIAFVQLNEDVVIDFLRYAEKLEELSMHHCNVKLNERFVYNIVDVRKHLNLVQSKPLHLIVDPFQNPEIEKVSKYHLNLKKIYLLILTNKIIASCSCSY